MWRGGAARRTLERIMRRQNLSYGTPQALPFYTRRLIPHHHSHWYAKSILCCIRTQLCLKQAWSSLKVLTNGNGSPSMPSIHMKTATNVRPWYTQNGLLWLPLGGRTVPGQTFYMNPNWVCSLMAMPGNEQVWASTSTAHAPLPRCQVRPSICPSGRRAWHIPLCRAHFARRQGCIF